VNSDLLWNTSDGYESYMIARLHIPLYETLAAHTYYKDITYPNHVLLMLATDETITL
jgi:hypothetical protein